MQSSYKLFHNDRSNEVKIYYRWTGYGELQVKFENYSDVRVYIDKVYVTYSCGERNKIHAGYASANGGTSRADNQPGDDCVRGSFSLDYEVKASTN